MSATLSPAEQAAIAAALEAGKVYRAARGESGLPGAYRPEAIGGGYNPGSGNWMAQSEAYRARNGFGRGQGLTLLHKTCDVCGRDFETYRPQTKRCSSECSKSYNRGALQAWREAKAAKIGPRPCKMCGNDFMPSHPAREVCSHECNLARRREHSRRWNSSSNMRGPSHGQVSHCVICGTEFTISAKHRKTCSRECSRKLRPLTCHGKGAGHV